MNLEGDTAIPYHWESCTEGGKVTSWLMVTAQIKQSKFPKGSLGLLIEKLDQDYLVIYN